MASYDVASKETDPVRPRNSGHHVAIYTFYAVTLLALFVAAVAIPLFAGGSAFLWPLTIFGAIIIAAVISGVAVPHLRDRGDSAVSVRPSSVVILLADQGDPVRVKWLDVSQDPDNVGTQRQE